LPSGPSAGAPEGFSPLLQKPWSMKAMAFIWAVVLIGGIAYFSVIGLSHH
jgi:hypothetical protein